MSAVPEHYDRKRMLAFDSDSTESNRLKTKLRSLTRRERQVFLRLFCGENNQTIALNLGISPRTSEKYRTSLLQKLGIPNQVGVVLAIVQAFASVEQMIDEFLAETYEPPTSVSN